MSKVTPIHPAQKPCKTFTGKTCKHLSKNLSSASCQKGSPCTGVEL